MLHKNIYQTCLINVLFLPESEETGEVSQRTATIFTTLLRVRYGTVMIFLALLGILSDVSP